MIKTDSQIINADLTGLHILGYCETNIDPMLKSHAKEVFTAELKAIFKALDKIDPDIITDAIGEYIMMRIDEEAKHDKDNRS